ncbi:MAG TPA: hypothetical protein VGG06_20110 [Thermoanaerobaculia bacterium]|jgi:putative Mn2+ efflux pump MntP
MSEPIPAFDYGSSEYDVVSLRIRPGVLSVVCGLLTVAFATSIDELPFVLGGRLRPYVSGAVAAALGLNVVGIVLGVYAARTPSGRAAGRLGVIVNAVVLVLLGFFVLVFRRIRWGVWF